MSRYHSYCMNDDQNLIVSRLVGTLQVTGSSSHCKETVLLPGTNMITARISEYLGMVLSNPYPSDQFGLFFDYALSGSRDVQLSDSGISTYTISETAQFNQDSFFTSANAWAELQTAVNVNSQNPNRIRFADQFFGTDWCAKVTAADADLGITPGEIWVSQAAGQSACAAAPTLSTSAPRVLRFIQPGIYPIGVGWTLTYAISVNSNTSFIGPPGTILSFTGNAGMVIDGTAADNGARNIYWENISVFGNASITNALTLKKVIASTFINLKAWNVPGVAVLCQFCVVDTFIRPKVSGNEHEGTIHPAEGITFDWISNASNASNDNLLISPVVEGLKTAPGIGIHVAHAGEIKAMGGTSEGNLIGIQVDASLAGFNANSFSNMDLEANTKNDIVDNGTSTEFQLIQSDGTATIGAFAADTRLLNGFYNQIIITAGAKGVHVQGLAYNSQNTGGLTNNGTGTTKLRVYNMQTGVYDPEVLGTFASLSTSGQITSTLTAGAPPFSVASTTPVANLTASNHPKVQSCGTSAACSPSILTGAQIAQGSVALFSGTPSTATVTGILPAFTSSNSYNCILTNGTTASNGVKVTYVSGSSFTITGPNSVTDVINYICVGN
jgi:hypothetical protein